MRKRQLFKKRILALALSVSMVFASMDTYVVLASETENLEVVEDIDSISQSDMEEDSDAEGDSGAAEEIGSSDDSDAEENSDSLTDETKTDEETDNSELAEDEAVTSDVDEASEDEAQLLADEDAEDTVSTAAADIARDVIEEEYGNITWVIDGDGKLTVTGTGDFSDKKNSASRIPWYDYKDYITSAEIKVEDMTDASYMFQSCRNLVSIDLSGFDTSQITDMGSMFSDCRSLSSIDLSGFDTSQITDMGSMFDNCYNLSSIDVSGFDTSQVTSMERMFNACSSLSSIDVSRFDTSQVTDMSYMFSGCSSLLSIDVSRFNTSQVTDMNRMFNGCRSLSSIDLSSFDTNLVTDTSYMLNGCNNLSEIYTPLNLNRSVSLPEGAWYRTDELRVVELPQGLNYSIVITKGSIPVIDNPYIIAYKSKTVYASGEAITLEDLSIKYIDEEGKVTTVTTGYSTNASAIDIDTEGIKTLVITYNGLTYEIELVVYTAVEGIAGGVIDEPYGHIAWVIDDSGKLTVTGTGDYAISNPLNSFERAPWYNYRDDITSAEIKVKNITDASHMFYDCQNLSSIDVSSFDTSRVTNMWAMFADCSKLGSIDLSGFDTSQVTAMDSMFDGCNNLSTIYTPHNLNLSVPLPEGTWYKADGEEIEELPQGLDHSIVIAKDSIPEIGKPYITAAKTKNVYEIGEALTLEDLTVEYHDEEGNVTTVIEYATNASEINMSTEGIKTLVITYNELTCEIELIVYTAVEGIARGVIDKDYGHIVWVIDRSGKLTVTGTGDYTNASLNPWSNVPWYNYRDTITSAEINVKDLTNASYMFYGCKNLSSIDLSRFDTSKVTDMQYMFDNCIMLGSIDLSGFDTSQVTNMGGMFRHCETLSSIDLSSFDTRNVTIMGGNSKGMFENCYKLSRIDLSSFDTSRVTNMWRMFSNCYELRSIDVSSFNTSQVTDMCAMFYACENLRSIDLSSFDTGNVTRMSSMFGYCENLRSIDLSSFDTSHVTDMNSMFYRCYELRSIDLSSFDTGQVTNMYGMFWDCKTLSSIDISGFDTGKVTNISYMFRGCETMSSIDMSHFDASQVKSNSQVFNDCNALSTIYTPLNLNTAVSLWDGLWYMPDGTEITRLPQELDYSILITKGSRPVIDKPYITAYKSKTVYMCGDEIDLEDLRVKYIDEEGKVTDVIEYSTNASDIDMSTEGTKILIITYNDLTCEIELTVEPKMEPYITAFKEKTVYECGDEIDLKDLTVEYHDERGNVTIVTTGYSTNASDIDMNTEGTKILIITYNGLTCEIELTVTKKRVSEGFHINFVNEEDKESVYTGAAIKPAIEVTYNGYELIEGIDYTVKYSNNVKASENAKITVTGKGSYTGKTSELFTIKKKALSEPDVEITGVELDENGNMVLDSAGTPTLLVAEKTKASPVLIYYGMKLTSKDFTVEGNQKWTGNGSVTIKAKDTGNFSGERKLNIKVISKQDLKKFTVTVDKSVTYDGGEHKLIPVVTDSKTKENLAGTDYTVTYSKDVTKAGTVKVTVVGRGYYTGSVTKSYKIKPITALETDMEVELANKTGYTFKSTGVILKKEDITVKYKEKPLAYGTDYKVTCSNNKKVGDAVKYKVTFIGNYKGSKAVSGNFTINKATLNDETAGLKISVPDKVYTGKPGIYKSVPYVSINGVSLKASDYTVTYWADSTRNTNEIKGKENNITVTDEPVTVYVKIEGRGNNYETPDGTYATATYKVYPKPSDSKYDLSKAKITLTFKDKDGNIVKKPEFIGDDIEVKPTEIKVECKSGKNWETVPATEYTVEYVNNVYKGKATVLIKADSTVYAGSKASKFSIGAYNLNILRLFL